MSSIVTNDTSRRTFMIFSELVSGLRYSTLRIGSSTYFSFDEDIGETHITGKRGVAVISAKDLLERLGEETLLVLASSMVDARTIRDSTPTTSTVEDYTSSPRPLGRLFMDRVLWSRLSSVYGVGHVNKINNICNRLDI